ncbi:hypothetical protein B0J12DRAFT_167377 [Macrophomina phaseolina]|uniref:Uncharacterized protein n=1 Tax=Macrophomina phaseolina TaxID=35725 RepID=A0ABQ8GSA0_9PEZI|nr:hypothetical protein B0J12DRAFT_167377 [Macrophomina phaseolina]
MCLPLRLRRPVWRVTVAGGPVAVSIQRAVSRGLQESHGAAPGSVPQSTCGQWRSLALRVRAAPAEADDIQHPTPCARSSSASQPPCGAAVDIKSCHPTPGKILPPVPQKSACPTHGCARRSPRASPYVGRRVETVLQSIEDVHQPRVASEVVRTVAASAADN